LFQKLTESLQKLVGKIDSDPQIDF
jgi:hypothetical protein